MIIKELFSSSVTRRRAVYTLFILVVYTIFASIPLPGLHVSVLTNPILEIIGATTGGAYTRYTLFALGLAPYVTASIIVQVLSSGLNKTLTELSKRGHVGRKRLKRYTRYLTIIFALVQAPVMLVGYKRLHMVENAPHLSIWQIVYLTLLITAGAMLAMYLGETLNRHGLGSGVSILIAGNIVSQFPHTIKQVFGMFHHTKTLHSAIAIVILFVVGLIVIVTLNMSEYRYPLQHSREAHRTSSAGYLPIKVNSSGMIPVIVAGAVLTIVMWFKLDNLVSMIIYALAVYLFGLVYSIIQVDPEKVTRQLEQSGTYIVGVNLEDTEQFFTRKILKINAFGSFVLMLLAVVPYATGLQGFVSLISWLIVAGVVIETVKQIHGLDRKYHYDTNLVGE